MKPGPSLAVRILRDRIDLSAAPRAAYQWLVEICISEEWCASPAEAEVCAERWLEGFQLTLQRELAESRENGQFLEYELNSSSEYMVQGCAFIAPSDPPAVQDAKVNAARFKDYIVALRELKPRQFEALCAGILSKLGVKSPVLTRESGDQGIDFFGQLSLETFLTAAHQTPGVQRQLSIWMIGQAKRYLSLSVSTPDIRDLVGAIELAKGKAFASSADLYPELKIRVCDPIFYLFMTTGRISADGVRLMKNSGVVWMDGRMIAAFLAEQGIGVKDAKFDQAALVEWLKTYLPTGS